MIYPSIVSLHYVSDDTRLDGLKPWVVTTKAYDKLLDYISDNGYNTIGFEEMAGGKSGKKDIIITFDDCPKHLWEHAIPELQKRGMKAVFYMPTAHIGSNNIWNTVQGLPHVDLMNEDDLRRLVDAGMEVGSHTHEHVMLSEHSKVYAQDALVRSKKILEEITGKEVVSVAYPYGDEPIDYKSIVSNAGYKYGLSVNTIFESRYALRRWIFFEEDTEKDIRWKMSFIYTLKRRITDKTDYWGRKMLSGLYNMYASVKRIFTTVVGLACMHIEELQLFLLEVEVI